MIDMSLGKAANEAPKEDVPTTCDIMAGAMSRAANGEMTVDPRQSGLAVISDSMDILQATVACLDPVAGALSLKGRWGTWPLGPVSDETLSAAGLLSEPLGLVRTRLGFVFSVLWSTPDGVVGKEIPFSLSS